MQDDLEKLEKKRKKNLLLLEKHLSYQGLKFKRFVDLLILRKSQALLHQQVTEELAEKVFRKCLIMVILMMKSKLARKKIFSILAFQPKSKWMTFLDKLSSSQDQNTLHIILFQTLVQELILKEKASDHYWTPAYVTESEKWSLPIETGYAGSVLNLLKVSSSKQVEKSPSLVLKTKKLMNPKNSQMTCSQLLPSSVADKWEEEVIKTGKANQKTIKIKIYPSREQKSALNEIFSVYNYVYNNTNEFIKTKKYSYLKWMDLRDKLVTCDTKKGDPEYLKNTKLIAMIKNKKQEINHNINKDNERDTNELLLDIQAYSVLEDSIRYLNKEINSKQNESIKDFEKKIHKNIRADAVKVCCEMYKSANTNLKNGNIKWFNIGYKKKSSPNKCFGGIDTKMIKFKNQKIQMMSSKLGKDLCDFSISKKSYSKYSSKDISGECKVFYQKGNYFIGLTLLTESKNTNKTQKVCGIDPGLRSFCTIYDKENVLEINQNRAYLKALNMKIKSLKALRLRPKNEKDMLRKRRRKRHFNKIEKKKIDYTNSIHWATISFLLNTYDTILLGDIKSHDIVKKGFNKSNNQEFNDLKFSVFKQRLIYKAGLANKFVKLVNEFNTTKCCSNCGNLNHFVGASEIYNCNKCKMTCDRDSNAAKNILLKGILC